MCTPGWLISYTISFQGFAICLTHSNNNFQNNTVEISGLTLASNSQNSFNIRVVMDYFDLICMEASILIMCCFRGMHCFKMPIFTSLEASSREPPGNTATSRQEYINYNKCTIFSWALPLSQE